MLQMERIEFSKACVEQIKEAISELNELGIECSFDESTFEIL
jgi:hypothetical protein